MGDERVGREEKGGVVKGGEVNPDAVDETEGETGRRVSCG